MKIAFTHNLQLHESEDEAEFDRPETVAALTAAIRGLGHEVEPVEVSGPASRVVARLEALAPDLIFNTAEGTKGRFREAFYPALFERLGFPFTGSDAYVCALTLDKHLTKRVLADHGVPTPKWQFVDSLEKLSHSDLRYPIMVKPNFEGSSMGITKDSVVESETQLRARTQELLARFPAGVLLEEFIKGRDLVVPYLQKASPQTGGVLEPAVYEFDPTYASTRDHLFYDLELKTTATHAISVKVPANLPPAVRKRAIEYSQTVFRVLGINDVARNDFRLTDDGELYFLEINALPSLEAGASLYLAGELIGIHGMAGVLDCIVRSAAERYGLSLGRLKPSRRKQAPLRIGIAYNDISELPALRTALAEMGHETVELEATPELPGLVTATGCDLIVNVAEGLKTKNRGAQIPALLELVDIVYTGSDSAALSLSLDRTLAKRIVAQAGIITPPTIPWPLPKDISLPGISFPLQIKSMVAWHDCPVRQVVRNSDELRQILSTGPLASRTDLMLEPITGSTDFWVGLLGERRPQVLPVFESSALSHDSAPTVASLEKNLLREIKRVARSAFSVLGCRDLCLVELRLEQNGKISFLGCNPAPSLAPQSLFCQTAHAAGMDFRTLIGELIAPAMRRLREKRREVVLSGALP